MLTPAQETECEKLLAMLLVENQDLRAVVAMFVEERRRRGELGDPYTLAVTILARASLARTL